VPSTPLGPCAASGAVEVKPVDGAPGVDGAEVDA
jgi:hypothetical protein